LDTENHRLGPEATKPHRGDSKSRHAEKRALSRDSADEFRLQIAKALLRIALLLGIVLLIPAAVLAFRDGDFGYLAVCCLGYASILVLYLSEPRPGNAIYLSMIGLVFLIGVFLVARYGSVSAGQTWLCAATMLATVFFGMRGAILSCLGQALVLAAIGGAESLGLLTWKMDALKYSLAALDGIALGVITGAAQFYLIGGLHSSIEARGKLALELDRRQQELMRESAGRQDAELRADFLERHDPLTRLPNRETFELELARAVEVAAGRGRILAVMAVGVDRFKRVGETHGPGAGDAVLIDIGVRLSRSFRADDLVARSGGDVFLVLLSDVKSPEDAKEIIEKSRRAFDRSFSVGGSELGLSASFGLALYPNDGQRAELLIRAAEAALHLAKNDGPGSYRLYDASLHSRLIAKALIEHQLRGALRAEAFLPWYQPKVDILGRIVGAEALARWSLPGGAFRQPSEFIGAAERSGVIGDLGRLVLAKACASAAAWERKGLEPIPISVNLSPYQFRSDELVKDVRRILGATGLPPSRLDLEITESGIMEDQSSAIDKMAELKALGCSISIDDFGTGYSSFATLRDFPADHVKLPQSFVEPLPNDRRASTITGAVIDLAHRLNISVVAEGVENRSQFAWLCDASCDQYQGFLFSRPMPEADFEAALAKGLGPAVE
jgi:diguanylate cyclase (GGDEF)-like protein